MPWLPGRLGTGYDKFRLFEISWPIRADAYLIRYNDGSYAPPHKDPVKDGRHYRVNIVLRHPERGGEFRCPEAFINWPRLKFFRSDRHVHSVTVVYGVRLVLSIGWVR